MFTYVHHPFCGNGGSYWGWFIPFSSIYTAIEASTDAPWAITRQAAEMIKGSPRRHPRLRVERMVLLLEHHPMDWKWLPSGKRLHSYGKSPFFIINDKWAMCNSYMKLPKGNNNSTYPFIRWHNTEVWMFCPMLGNFEYWACSTQNTSTAFRKSVLWISLRSFLGNGCLFLRIHV